MRCCVCSLEQCMCSSLFPTYFRVPLHITMPAFCSSQLPHCSRYKVTKCLFSNIPGVQKCKTCPLGCVPSGDADLMEDPHHSELEAAHIPWLQAQSLGLYSQQLRVEIFGCCQHWAVGLLPPRSSCKVFYE